MSSDVEMRAERDDAPDRARPDRPITLVLVASVLVVGSVLAAWLWSTASEHRVAPPAVEAKAPAVVEAPPPARLPAGGSVHHPVAAAGKPLEPQEIAEALSRLLGSKAAATFLHTDGFPRRFAATADSLARGHSPTAAWPVSPTPGRFLVEEREDGPVIAAENAARYTPLVLLAGTIDVPAAAHMYRRMYPLLQQAYRELGFGDRYLNDQVLELVDLLLATPEAPVSPRLVLLPVKGPVPSLQPWVRYQFADPQLEALSAGQKILVRVGPVNERRLKAKLAELRKELAMPPLAADTAEATAGAPASAAASGAK